MWSVMPRPRDRNWFSRAGARQEPDCAGYSANERPISYRIARLAPVAQWIERPPPKGQVGRSIRLRGTTDFSPAATLRGIGLPARLGVDERIQFHALFENAHDGRIRRQVALVALRVEHLRHQATIGDGDPVSYTHLRAHETRHDLVCRL